MGVAFVEGESFRDGVAGGFYVLFDLGRDVELVGEQGDFFSCFFSQRDFEGFAQPLELAGEGAWFERFVSGEDQVFGASPGFELV